nr:hypothetical protein MarFTME_401 [Marseillevirus futianmevirus]
MSGRVFERNPFYVEPSSDEEMPELLSPSAASDDEDSEILAGETLDAVRDEIYGGFDYNMAHNVLCPCCDVYRGQKNVVVFVRGKTCPEAESFKEFAKFERNTWF